MHPGPAVPWSGRPTPGHPWGGGGTAGVCAGSAESNGQITRAGADPGPQHRGELDVGCVMALFPSAQTGSCTSARCRGNDDKETHVIGIASQSYLESPDAVSYLLYLAEVVILLTWTPETTGGGEPTLLKALLRARHWQKHSTFTREWDKVARTIDPQLTGSWPRHAQFYRWLRGELRELPYPDSCRVLEAMFPQHSARDLFQPCPSTTLQHNDKPATGNGTNELGTTGISQMWPRTGPDALGAWCRGSATHIRRYQCLA